ncbi:Transcriptional regulator GlxA family, contains an amidase domain and an AraC-type DNA-binding HTH domain [Mycobacterium numidiamassiliense]|uniref:Transcriptional regulator GlxA family, contains an amidase domain and an AraC-type DNA-binding HTH domain n=1 Tax=Mycobacterium numidiamassiliense TaxID=1841861 RepID=A0A2U3PHN6_9MYCO|nr:DJ-1/PfpI family protein [Mycobacterium numidiamassiliense]SPM43219.1 Transcriptional regulator GlxA family, contains an amidase domain and an AraC-type DNA-binding HTH domain [Mycobacterium numidiamassiliense]
MSARRVVIVGFPRVQSLDVSGPYEVFAEAGTYRIEVAAPQQGAFNAASGLELSADVALADVRGRIDTLIVAGGYGVFDVIEDAEFLHDLQRAAKKSRRVGSICTGAFALAAAGLLEGRRATTHWRFSEQLRSCYPSVDVDADPIYIQSDNVYTSAGITAGMDLALALVEEDRGHDLAMTIAREFVLFMRRPGGQSQFSTALAAQTADREPLRELQAWIVENLSADLSVEMLAERAHMSPRHFARVFSREVGQTPARYVEQVRVEAAQRRLEESTDSLEEIAGHCGFGSVNSMRRSFLRIRGIPPSAYRQRFSQHQETRR